MAGPFQSVFVGNSQNYHQTKVALIVADWNEEITGSLYEAAVHTLMKYGFQKENLIKKRVPGSFELTYGALKMAEKENIQGVICLGCVIQGETPHFDYICQAVAHGITELNIQTGKPIIFGVLTTLNKQQALDRAGGKYGNKGEEAALTLMQMLSFT